MKTGFYSKIARDNIKKNPRLYVPRIFAESGLLGCFYIAFALASDERLANVKGGDYVIPFMGIGTAVLGALSLIIILYINSFLMKRRKSEYGLYNVLGMEKRHIVKVLFLESVFTSLSSVILGLGFGILFYKLFSLLICRLIQTDVIAGFYYINGKTIIIPVIVFAGLDLIAFFANRISVFRLKPVELLLQVHTGEKEPKVKWILLVIGVLTLGAGYIIALTVKTGISALLYFFPAVILVIIGTYCLFITGTIFVLKCLKKNKKYYYDKKHMPAVSGLLFRMRQNAVGLASIAILATAILVMISTTVSLYSSMEDMLDTRYPQQLYLSAIYEKEGKMVSISPEELADVVKTAASNNNLEINGIDTEQFLTVSYLLRDGKLLTKKEVTGDWDYDEIVNAIFITESSYEAMIDNKNMSNGKKGFKLNEDEIVYCRISSELHDMTYQPSTLTINGMKYKVKDSIDYFPIQSNMENVVMSIGIIVSDEKVLEDVYLAQKYAYGENASEFTDRIAVTFPDEESATGKSKMLEKAITEGLRNYSDSGEIKYTLDTKWEAKESLLGMYGSFLFLGIILGFVFLFSTILIMYYKQISEGYEDRNRFQIMQKIGMEEREVKETIRSQMILQFFLPLITAGIHTVAAFPMLLKLLSLLMLPDIVPAIICAIVTFAVFSLMYVMVYVLTSKTYYKIVH